MASQSRVQSRLAQGHLATGGTSLRQRTSTSEGVSNGWTPQLQPCRWPSLRVIRLLGHRGVPHSEGSKPWVARRFSTSCYRWAVQQPQIGQNLVGKSHGLHLENRSIWSLQQGVGCEVQSRLVTQDHQATASGRRLQPGDKTKHTSPPLPFETEHDKQRGTKPTDVVKKRPVTKKKATKHTEDKNIESRLPLK